MYTIIKWQYLLRRFPNNIYVQIYTTLTSLDHKQHSKCVIFANTDTHDVTEGVDDNDDAEWDDQDCISHPGANDKIACNTKLALDLSTDRFHCQG